MVKEHVALSAFAYLFSEMVQYHSMRIQTAAELERRLEESGHSVGLRILELLTYRERQVRHETRVVGVLQVPEYAHIKHRALINVSLL